MSEAKHKAAVDDVEAPEKPAPRPDELWHCRNEAWATLANGWNHPVQSLEFRHWLIGECVRLGQGSKKGRIDALVERYTATALYDGPEHQLYLRTAPAVDGGVYIDLANETGKAVHVGAEGWRIIRRPPVKFYRPGNMKALPFPLREEADRACCSFCSICPMKASSAYC